MPNKEKNLSSEEIMSIEYIRGVQAEIDKNETIKLLRSALADEYNAMYAYWVQAKVIQGTEKEKIDKELYQHRDEEMGHANMLMDRILQLGGNPEIAPGKWNSLAGCDYAELEYWDQKNILDEALKGEYCAVKHYQKIADFVRNKDITTYDIVMKIISDEHEHIDDLSKLLELVEKPKDQK